MMTLGRPFWRHKSPTDGEIREGIISVAQVRAQTEQLVRDLHHQLDLLSSPPSQPEPGAQQ